MLRSTRQTLDRAAGLARWPAGRLLGLGRLVGGGAIGTAQRLRHRSPAPKDLDDVTLARKVETEIFRPADAPKGTVNVDVVDGVVTLRGEVKTAERIKQLEAAARAIPEVRDVENLLKQPKTPSRTRADAPGRAKRTGGRKPSAAAGGRSSTATSGRFNRETRSPGAEETPKERAATGAGRTAAPLGAREREVPPGDKG